MSATARDNAITIIPLHPTNAAACEAIGRALPAWFGIEQGLQELRHAAETQSGFVAAIADTIVGFVTLEQHFPETWEISWMAVHPDHHRRGIGRMLIDAALDHCRSRDASVLLVKTLADTHPSPEYAGTRRFYERMEFLRLQVFPEWWDPANPCLLMARTINSETPITRAAGTAP